MTAVLVISGSMGAGKTTVMGEVSDVLAAARLPHAAIDLDALGIVHDAGAPSGDLMIANLRAVAGNYAAAGISRFVLAGAIESRSNLNRIRSAIGADAVIVCRLRASLTTMRDRVRRREPGMLQSQFLERVAALEQLLDAAGVDAVIVDNDNRPVSDVAHDVLRASGWLITDAPTSA
jgi:hypothetical protein